MSITFIFACYFPHPWWIDFALTAIVLMFDYGKNAFVADDNENCRSEWTNSKNSTDNLMVGRRYNDNYMFFKALW